MPQVSSLRHLQVDIMMTEGKATKKEATYFFRAIETH